MKVSVNKYNYELHGDNATKTYYGFKCRMIELVTYTNLVGKCEVCGNQSTDILKMSKDDEQDRWGTLCKIHLRLYGFLMAIGYDKKKK